MINNEQNENSNEENIDDSLNVENTEEAINFSITSNETPECPICIEPKTNMVGLLCGHAVCDDCKTLLIQHSQLNVCPLCRFPLNWQGLVQYYESNDDEIQGQVIGQIVGYNMPNDVPNNIPNNNQRRLIRRHRDRTNEACYNLCGALVGVAFIILFWFMIAV